MSQLVAKIAVASAVYSMDKPYDYKVPPALSEQIRPGMRVIVPFGRGNRRVEGLVLLLTKESRPRLKTVERLLDDAPVLSAELLRTAAFVRERFFCTFYDAVRAALPAGLWFSTQDTFRLSDPAPENAEALLEKHEAARAVADTLRALGGEAKFSDLRRQFDEASLQKALRFLRDRKLITSDTDLRRRANEKTEQLVSLAVSAEEARAFAARKRKSAPVQAAVIEMLLSVPTIVGKELGYFTGATAATLRRLESLGYLRLTTQPLYRRPRILPGTQEGPITLNDAQSRAYARLSELRRAEKPGTALLYGVTGSGKTEVYLRLIEDTLAEGKSAMLLVPEIALTPQLTSRFAARFGDRVAVLHSALRVGERYDEWRRIAQGEARVVVGTRSAVFAPFPDLGLLILDEEQEHSYKSENTPRYHARDVAIFRGAQFRALVLLGSATPSVESMYRARCGKYALVQLHGRYNGMALPEVQLVDLREEIRTGNDSTISRPLLERLRLRRERGEQSILFLNRRGSSRLMVCVDCGEVPECPRCSVSLTYHGANGRLMCHYCGYSEPMQPRCPACGGHRKPVGAGTQKVAEELDVLLPGAEVLRMDADTVSATNTHAKLFSDFERRRIPVMVGTQMVAKGLNFENVTLVGVLDADLSLYVGNFRAAETTFSMITQVVGRAGRGAKPGCAVIQTMTPENPVLRLAAAQDYDSFYEQEILLRELRGCPPFSDLITITFHGGAETEVADRAARFRERLRGVLETPDYAAEQVVLLGPAPAPVPKINNTYRYRLTLQLHATRRLRALVASLLREFAQARENQQVSAFADLNGYD